MTGPVIACGVARVRGVEVRGTYTSFDLFDGDGALMGTWVATPARGPAERALVGMLSDAGIEVDWDSETVKRREKR